MSTNVLSLSSYHFYINGEWKESKSGEKYKFRTHSQSITVIFLSLI